MALQKVYQRINWENYPSESTPINERNLNKIDYGLNEVDNRLITIDTTKFNSADANNLVKNITFNDSNGVFTVTKLSGETFTIDTKLEKLAVNFSYDVATQRIVITLEDGTKQYIDLSTFITETEFTDSDTIAFSNTNHNVTAVVKDGSITESKLQPNYLADIKVEVAKTETASNNAQTYMNSAKGYSDNADAKASLAEQYKDTAVLSANNASQSEINAKASETNALRSANEARTSEVSAENSKVLAKQSEVNAKASETASKTSETNAKASETKAKTSETNAKTSETNAEAYQNKTKEYRDETATMIANQGDILAEVDKKLGLATFDIDNDGNLIYTESTTGYVFTVDSNGNLLWEVG